MNEAETHAEHVDPALKAAGWGVVDGSRVFREHSAFAAPNAWRDRFAAVPFEAKGGTLQGRCYQVIAFTRVLSAPTWPTADPG